MRVTPSNSCVLDNASSHKKHVPVRIVKFKGKTVYIFRLEQSDNMMKSIPIFPQKKN